MPSFKKLLSGLCAAALLCVGLDAARADVRIDIKNERTEECSVAFNARIDKTKWVTLGWFVFMSGEEAPVILKGANDIHDVFLYHDCDLTPRDGDEVKTAWIHESLKFTDYMPRENDNGYKKVEFIRLDSNSYIIAPAGK